MHFTVKAKYKAALRQRAAKLLKQLVLAVRLVNLGEQLRAPAPE